MAAHVTLTADLSGAYDAESPSLDHAFGLLLQSLDAACNADAASGSLGEDFEGIESLMVNSESVQGGDALTPALQKCKEMCEARFHLGR